MATYWSTQTDIIQSVGKSLGGRLLVINSAGKIILSKKLSSEIELGKLLLYKDSEPMKLEDLILVDNAVCVTCYKNFLILLSDGSYVAIIENIENVKVIENYIKFIEKIKESGYVCPSQIKIFSNEYVIVVHSNNTLIFWNNLSSTETFDNLDSIHAVLWYAYTSFVLFVCTLNSKLEMVCVHDNHSSYCKIYKIFTDYFNNSVKESEELLNNLLNSKMCISYGMIFIILSDETIRFYDDTLQDLSILTNFIDSLDNIDDIKYSSDGVYAFLLKNKTVIFLGDNRQKNCYYDRSLSIELFGDNLQVKCIPQLNNIIKLDYITNSIACCSESGFYYTNNSLTVKDFIPNNLKKYRILYVCMNNAQIRSHFTTNHNNDFIIYDDDGINITDEVFACGAKIHLPNYDNLVGSYI